MFEKLKRLIGICEPSSTGAAVDAYREGYLDTIMGSKRRPDSWTDGERDPDTIPARKGTTLETALKALGYGDASRQLALVKELHAIGAFGELPGVDDMDDLTAEAILETLTFDDMDQAVYWLRLVTQEPPGPDR